MRIKGRALTKEVVLIDDEHGPMDLYVRALREAAFRVKHLDSVAVALEHIREARTPADLYILDLMMPPGDAMDLETAGYGLKSGVELHRCLRARWSNVPVIVLTSVSNPSILDLLPFDENTTCEAKIDVLPFELVEIVRLKLSNVRN